MAAAMKPIDLILGSLSMLTTEEINQVRAKLQMHPLEICETKGHKYKKVEDVMPFFLGTKKSKLTCTVCGNTILV